MEKLIDAIRAVAQQREKLPFSVYSSHQEQVIKNIPIANPLLIFVLSGCKKLGAESELICQSGSFVFLSNEASVVMRNIPNDEEYLAVLVEFEYSDFVALNMPMYGQVPFVHGAIELTLKQTLEQFVEWSTFSNPDLWFLRRRELLHVLISMGHQQVISLARPPRLSHQVHTIVREKLPDDIDCARAASILAMSESTLRRKLNVEGISFQAVKDRAKLGYGLHLIQTSFEPIGVIAEQCGYASQSRFTDKFKRLFNVTPTALRKTRVSGSG